MMWFKSCPRCQTGDQYLDEDDAKHCMQCGHKQYPPAETVVLGGKALVLPSGPGGNWMYGLGRDAVRMATG